MWLVIALISFAVSAVVSVLDKFLISKSEIKPLIFTFYTSIFVLPILLFVPFGVVFPTYVFDWCIFFISGFSFVIGLWVMYKGFKISEVSHIGPLIGAATAFFVLILSGIFLKENLGVYKIIAIAFLIVGSLIVSFENSPEHNGVHFGMLLGAFAGLLFAISNVTAKYAYNVYGFYSGFVWTRAFLGIACVSLLIFPSVRALFHEKKKKEAVRDIKQIIVVSWDKILGVVGVILFQYATSLGSVTLVNALAGVQYGILIVLVAILSKFWPKKFKEEYGRGEIIQEFIAILFIGGGLALMLLK